MRTWLALALATIAFPLAAPAHVVDKTSITVAVGQKTTITLGDDGSGCTADMKAKVDHASVASVTPLEARATTVTFTITGLKAGATFLELEWEGVSPCSDDGKLRIPLQVTGGSPNIIVGSFPDGLAQETGIGDATETFTIVNTGGAAGQFFLLRGATFFNVSPTSGTLQPGETATVTLTGIAHPAGLYEGSVEVTGDGVAPGTVVPVRLISANRPSTPPRPRPAANRVDVIGSEVTGVARFVNEGTGTLRGVVTSDVPWIQPTVAIVDAPGGATVDVPFLIHPARRPAGVSAAGTLAIQYLLSPIGKSAVEGHESPGTSKTLVTVVSTVPPPAAPGVIPPLVDGEVALFATGVGRLQGSVGLYLSDLTLTSLDRVNALPEVRLFYTPVGGATSTAAVESVSPQLSTALGDLVRGVFQADGQSGSLQIRAADVNRLSAAANIINSSNPAGTFGTAIPILRSDRAAIPGETLVIPGIRKNASGHTNVWLQEGSGTGARVRVTAFDEGGALTSEQTVDLPPFGAAQLVDPFPTGTAAIRLAHADGSSGSFLGYATPVDRSSGDFWAVTDWARQTGTAPDDTVVLPVAGSVRGANNTDFRTDVALTAGGTGAASLRLRYLDRSGTSQERTVDIVPFGSVLYEDVTRTLFGIDGDALGYLVATPLSGSFHASARTYNLVAGSGATYGTSVPALPLAAAIGFGQSRRFGGVDDADDSTVAEGRPGTTRTNFGLVEVAGAPATVRVTLTYLVPSSLVTAIGSGSATIELAPNQFVLTSRIASAILGNFRRSFGDLRNLQVDFEVVNGAGRVLPFLSSTDNGTGDSILRTE